MADKSPDSHLLECRIVLRVRRVLLSGLCLLLLTPACGCLDGGNSAGNVEAVWGRRGISEGRLQKPRAMAIDARDNLYIVDMTARIQVFTREGQFLRGWQTPVWKNGKPSGLTIDREGNLLVADTHYYRMLKYSPTGKLLLQIGGQEGQAPGEFGFVTDAVQDSQGYYYISEYGEYDRVQKFTADGQFVLEWGGHGSEPGQFVRPQNMAIDHEDRIWVADAGNHRIQVFDRQGQLLKVWGSAGKLPGELYYPYDLAFDDDGNLIVCEFGNNRVQKFTPDGESLGCWGTTGRETGQLYNPWALVVDSQGSIHVLDTNNHRLQRIQL